MRRWFILAALVTGACTQQVEAPPEPAPITFDGAAASDAAARLEHGERLAIVLGCVGCHGKDLTGEDWSEPGFGQLWTANLTRAISRYDDVELVRVITGGARADRELWEMPSHLFTRLAPGDMSDLVAFLRSKPPAGVDRPSPKFEEGARREIAAGTLKSSSQHVREHGNSWPPDAGTEHEFGRYVVRATCAECHGMDLRGGQPHAAATPRPDLRMVGGYDLAQFTRLLRTGKAAGDRELSLMSEVARGRYARLTDREVAAVHAYLQTVANSSP